MTRAMCRELGPLLIYVNSKKAKNLGDKICRFGKAGGNVNDGSPGSNDTELLGKNYHSPEEVEKNCDQRKRSTSTKELFEKKLS